MKNKTLKINSMKLKKVIAASLAISVLFAFTGCGSSSNSSSTDNKKQESTSTADAGSTDELNEKLNDLYQQENQLFADHKEAWDKVFGFMSKNTSGDSMTCWKPPSANCRMRRSTITRSSTAAISRPPIRACARYFSRARARPDAQSAMNPLHGDILEEENPICL